MENSRKKVNDLCLKQQKKSTIWIGTDTSTGSNFLEPV